MRQNPLPDPRCGPATCLSPEYRRLTNLYGPQAISYRGLNDRPGRVPMEYTGTRI